MLYVFDISNLDIFARIELTCAVFEKKQARKLVLIDVLDVHSLYRLSSLSNLSRLSLSSSEPKSERTDTIWGQQQDFKNKTTEGLQYVLFVFSSHIYFLSVLPQPVLLKVAGLFAGIVALITGVGTFSSVNALVYFKMARASTRIVALVTPERFLS